tara:strand:+ start:150 stop:434 length:285 start_codon:yes stop_codon:yes gene_type:complete
MNKVQITLALVTISILVALLTISQTNIIELPTSSKKLNVSSFTKAICKDNYCQDYKFECKNNKTTSITPITGAAIQFDKEWKDPRTKEQIAKSC